MPCFISNIFTNTTFSNYGIEYSSEVEESFNTLVKDFKALNDIFGEEKLDELFDIVMYYA